MLSRRTEWQPVKNNLSCLQSFTTSMTEPHSMFVYFDTNVFGHLFKKTQGITDQHETTLRTAIELGALCVFVGLHAIDETAANPRDPVPEHSAPGSARALAPTLRRAAGTHRGPRSFNCGAVCRRPKKSCAPALETASAALPTSLTYNAQMRFLG